MAERLEDRLAGQAGLAAEASEAGMVGRLLRGRREALGLTLAQVAQEAGLAKSYLSMIENGRVSNPPSRAALVALERALRIGDGELSRAAAWQVTPEPVKAALAQHEADARKAQELARWLLASTSRSAGGGKNLDKLFRSGELRRRIARALPEEARTQADAAAGAVAALPLPAAVRYQVPLINRVAAGYPRDFTDLDYPARVADEFVHCPDVDDPDAFAARVVGQSMLPDYREGDVVVFSPAAKVTDGCDCFVRLEPDHETTFKRIFFEPNDPESPPEHPPAAPVSPAGDIPRRLRLQPLNAQFPARIVDRDQVAGLYRAVWKLTRL